MMRPVSSFTNVMLLSLAAGLCLDTASTSVVAPKTLHLVRHAQAEHNLQTLLHGGHAGAEILDPRLTPLGHKQASDLRTRLAADSVPPPEFVVVSPLRRTLETAFGAFANHGTKVPRFLALELVREKFGNKAYQCDVRSDLSVLQAEFPSVDFSLVTREVDEVPDERETFAETQLRAEAFIRWAAARPEPEITVVSHSGFLAALFELLRTSFPGSIPGVFASEYFANCERRTVFIPASLGSTQDSVPNSQPHFRDEVSECGN